MKIFLELQNATTQNLNLPPYRTMRRWVALALKSASFKEHAALTVRFTDKEEIQNLNSKYRRLDKPTNILSFPAQEELSDAAVNNPADAACGSEETLEPILDFIECRERGAALYLGDLVICPQVLEAEAWEQHKSVHEHLAHLIIHGCLHLLGYDHIKEEDAALMESLEIAVLRRLGWRNPYVEN